MQPKIQKFSNFSLAVDSTGPCYRPENEWQLEDILREDSKSEWLARGNGLSYSDCCLLSDGRIIDTRRLNHLLTFDASSGIAACQGSATFADLFLFHSDFIPPVVPGTLFATVAGGIANDVHGKNNPKCKSFGHHVVWLELQIAGKTHYCDAHKNAELFFTTIAGLGLTGVIKRVGIQLQRASRVVRQTSRQYLDLSKLLTDMQYEASQNDYQVAWLDLLNEPRGVLHLANHENLPQLEGPKYSMNVRTLPKFRLQLINPWLMKKFNRGYYQSTRSKPTVLPLWQFNNPLDSLKNWNYLYGKNGLLQFQAVFDTKNAPQTLNSLLQLIKINKAVPTLAVLKLFTQSGAGLISFVQPGFTLAVDFINNAQSQNAIKAMNQYITEVSGKVYLAKDVLLDKQQFASMYPKHSEFSSLLAIHRSPMRSNLSVRLGIHT